MKEVCIIGFGGMGKRHAKDLEEFSGGKISVTWVVEPSDKRYTEGCEWIGHEPIRYSSIPEMLANARPDGIVVSTPNSLHLSSLNDLAGCEIPLIVEKPLEISLEKVFEVAKFTQEYKAPIMVHHVMRYAPIIQEARKLLRSGAIGRVGGFNMVQNTGGSMFHTFRRTFATGGGQLLEKATHDFDVLLYLVEAQPVRVASFCRRQYFGGQRPDDLRCPECDDRDDCRHARKSSINHDAVGKDNLCVFADCIDIFDREDCLIEMDNGLTGTYSQCFFATGSPFSRRYEFLGTDGFLSVNLSDRKVVLSNAEGQKEFCFDYHNRIHYNGAPGVSAHFLELMEGKTSEVISPVEDAVSAELIAFAAYRSNESGRFVDLRELTPQASASRESYARFTGVNAAGSAAL